MEVLTTATNNRFAAMLARRNNNQHLAAINYYPAEGILFSICCYLQHYKSYSASVVGSTLINASTAASRNVSCNPICFHSLTGRRSRKYLIIPSLLRQVRQAAK
jgi:hypothetical protein